VDTSSAEWIVEAPSDCVSASSCQTLPLANFGSAGFSAAHAVSTAGRNGAILSPWWDVTSIVLASRGGRQFISNATGSTGASAQPSALSGGGSSFTVSYRLIASPPGAFNTLRESQLRH
jgi:hypothetical protein